MFGPKRSRNLAAAIWEAIASSCPQTLSAYEQLFSECFDSATSLHILVLISVVSIMQTYLQLMPRPKCTDTDT